MIPAHQLLALMGFASYCLAQESAGDLGSVLSDHDNLSTFYDLIKDYPDILLQLPSEDGVTIIAPSNEAFENIPYTPLNEIWAPKNKSTTVPLLQYHILPTFLETSSLEAGPSTLHGTLLDSPPYTNVTTSQNVVLSKGNDDTVTIMSSLGTRCTVEEADIEFRGGVIHIVDNLLIPPGRLEEAAEAFQLQSFVGGLYKADRMPEAAERRNATIFAPQQKAFDAIGGSLVDLDNEALERVLDYHIVPDKVLASSSLTNGTKLTTLLEDSPLNVHQAGNNKFINSAQIIQPDILIANGILHVISDVLNPEAGNTLPDPEATSQSPLWPVSTVRNLFTSELPCTVSCPVTTTTSATSVRTSEVASTTEGESSVATTESEDAAARQTPLGHAGGWMVGLVGAGAGIVLL